MDDIRNRLGEELATVEWRALRTHVQRDSVILLAPELDMVEVAWCVARDRTADVAGWIAAGKVRKPGREELAKWERELEKPFRMLIVAPYVLIQPL
jgi:hypothetical protein